MHMSVPICGTWGISRIVSFLPLCYCCDALLGVQNTSELGFQLLVDNPHPWWLSLSWYYTWYEHFFITGTVPCHFAILHQGSYTLSHCLKWYQVLFIAGFDQISDSHIFPFSNFVEKLVSCMFSWFKTMKICLVWHANCSFGRIFAQETMCRYSLAAGLFLVLSQTHHQSQRWLLSLLWDLFLKSRH